jgi:hypothetical protein
MEKLVSRVVMLWIMMIFVTIGLLYSKMNEEALMFYNFGPSNTLLVFGLNVDTYPKYTVIVVYCFLNSLVRTASKDILNAYLVNSVQDVTREKSNSIRWFAYEVTYVTSVYGWIDWYIYMNLLLAQVDMLMIEISSDLLMSVITTRYYLNHKLEKEEEGKEVEGKKAKAEEEESNEVALIEDELNKIEVLV